MGDDELNFTEEEARCWADDPRNQARDWGAPERAFALAVALVILVLTLIWVASRPSTPMSIEPITEVLLPLASDTA